MNNPTAHRKPHRGRQPAARARNRPEHSDGQLDRIEPDPDISAKKSSAAKVRGAKSRIWSARPVVCDRCEKPRHARHEAGLIIICIIVPRHAGLIYEVLSRYIRHGFWVRAVWPQSESAAKPCLCPSAQTRVILRWRHAPSTRCLSATAVTFSGRSTNARLIATMTVTLRVLTSLVS